MRHVRALDGLRGVAVLAVVVFHFAPSVLPGGFLGVDLFFVLSGFLISSLVLREVHGTGGLGLSNFWVRRVRRLAPALLLVVAALAVYAAFLATPGELSRIRTHGLATIGYVANWQYIADGTSYTDLVVGVSPLRHTWSLAIEEQFYLIFPLVVVGVIAMVGRRAVPARTRVLVAALALVASFVSVVLMALSYDASDPSRAYYGTDTRIFALCIGVLLGALTLGDIPARPRGGVTRTARALGLVGAISLLVFFLVAHETDRWMYQGGFLAVALSAALVIAAARSSPMLRSVLGVAPLVGLGLISYGVYLWHWPIFVLVDEYATGLSGPVLFALRVALTLGVSVLSFRLIEQPIRKGTLGRNLGRGSILVAGGAVVLVTVGLFWATVVPPFDRDLARAEDRGSVAPAGNVSAGPRRVVLLGDSVAHTLAGAQVFEFPNFQRWKPEMSPFDPARVDLRPVTKPACSFLPGASRFRQPDGSYVKSDLSQFCDDWRSDLADEIAAGPTDVLAVLLTNDIGDRYVDGHVVKFGSRAHDKLVNALFDELATVAAQGGAQLALLEPPQRSGRFAVEGDADGRRERHFGDLARRFARTHPNVHVLDLADQICPAGDCDDPVPSFDPSWRYDGLHYMFEGAGWFADWLTAQVEQIAPVPAAQRALGAS